jgi:hypothetical protein
VAKWAAFERVWGPLLIHERIDYAGALNAYVSASVWGGRRYRLEDFLPRWGLRDNTDAIIEKMKALEKLYGHHR